MIRHPARRHLARLPFALLLLALAAGTRLQAQGVVVAPPGVFIDHRTRSGSIELYNPGTAPSEVSISTMLAYPVTDSLGRITLHVVEDPDSIRTSAAQWITAYPRRLTLQPAERQTVRLLARPPADLPDGEYWTRIVVAAKGAAVPVTNVGDTAGITVGLSLEVRTVIATFYRKGAIATGIALSDLQAAVTGDSVEVRARLARQGTGAFIGMARLTVADGAGRQVAGRETQLAVYTSMAPRFHVPLANLPAGRYTVTLQLDTERTDVARQNLLPASTVRESVAFDLPARSP